MVAHGGGSQVIKSHPVWQNTLLREQVLRRKAPENKIVTCGESNKWSLVSKGGTMQQFKVRTPSSRALWRSGKDSGGQAVRGSKSWLLVLFLRFGVRRRQVRGSRPGQQFPEVRDGLGKLWVTAQVLPFLRIRQLIVEFDTGGPAIPFGIAPALCAHAVTHNGFALELPNLLRDRRDQPMGFRILKQRTQTSALEIGRRFQCAKIGQR